MNHAVTTLLPSLNETETIVGVIDGLQEEGLTNILVIDGGSTDGTRKRAREAGARVEVQSGEGKGQAVREAMREYVHTSYVLMLDADGTSTPQTATLSSNPSSMPMQTTSSEPIARPDEDAMPIHRRASNRLHNLAFSLKNGPHGDVLSGYRAWTRGAWTQIDFEADGWGIETEINREVLHTDVLRTRCVPIDYHARPDGSHSEMDASPAGDPFQPLTLTKLVVCNIYRVVV